MTLKHFLPFVAFVGFCKIQRWIAFVAFVGFCKIQRWIAFVAFVGFCKTSLSVQLAWDPSPTPNVTYNLYYGPAHGFYTNVLHCGTNCTRSLTVPSGTNYFAVAAQTSTGIESAFSNEISWFGVPASAGTNLLVSIMLESALTITGPWVTVTNSRIRITNYQSAPAFFFRARLDTSISTNQ